MEIKPLTNLLSVCGQITHPDKLSADEVKQIGAAAGYAL